MDISSNKLLLLVCFVTLMVGCTKEKEEDAPPSPWAKELTPPEKADGKLGCWADHMSLQRHASAETAEKEYYLLRDKMGDEFALVTKPRLAFIYRFLGGGYLLENNYKKAFELHKASDEIYHIVDANAFLPYLAGLAGDVEWLGKFIKAFNSPKYSYYRVYLEENLAWAEKDYPAVSRLGGEYLRTYDPDDPTQSMIAFWASFLRVKALSAMGNNTAAVEESHNKKHRMNMDAIGYDSLTIHAFTELSRILEKGKDTEGALMTAQLAKKITEKAIVLIPPEIFRELDNRIAACKATLAKAATTRPKDK